MPRGGLGGRSCLVGCVLAGVVGLSGAGMRDAPAVLLLPACVGSGVWWVSLRVCGGGMLSGFWGSAPWSPGPCSAALCGWWGVGVGGLGVNCIVDASILLFVFCDRMFLVLLWCFVVCCFERSVDALASGADEGRGGLRYSSGSRLAGCDPRVSEWGDPARVMSCHLHLNCIGCGG